MGEGGEDGGWSEEVGEGGESESEVGALFIGEG